MDSRIDYYLNKSKHFPTLPTIYTSLMNVISNPRSTIQDVADVISRDQASSSKLLRIANSSFYSIKGKISTISQAVFYLGFNEVRNILLALSVMDVFSKAGASSNYNILNLWRHSIAVGVISKLLAQKIGLKDTEDFFVAGILHDIGKLFFMHSFKKEYDELITKAKEESRRLIDLEYEKYGVSHDLVGGMLADKWSLPHSLKKVIQFHNAGVIAGKTDTILACVHLGNIIAVMMDSESLGDIYIPQPRFEIWNVLNLPPGSLADMYQPIDESVKSAYTILKIN
jgi:putative nucleotidyltransferase with HDIG domain